MENKIKNKIDSLKKDKSIFKEYVADFCNIDKANELFKNNKEFKSLKEYVSNKDNKKIEFYD